MKKEKKKKVILAFSGGLDTSFCVLYLKEQGYEVISLTVGTGSMTEKEKKVIANRAKELGVKEHIFVDAKDSFYKNIITYVIKGNLLRGGVYPLCAGPERMVIAEVAVRVAQKEKALYVAHGSTGAGNDQIRFELGIKSLDPSLQIIAPIRDLQITRAEEIAFLQNKKIKVSTISKSYSINKGLLGTTIGGKETKNSWNPLPEEIYPDTIPLAKTPNKSETIIISFKQGIPVAINNKKMNGITIMEYLSKVGGKHGVGKNIHLGNTILGIKGRVGFTAPAIMILIKSHKELEKLVQTKWQSFWKDTLSEIYGGFLHEALYYDPIMRDIKALLDSSQKYVEGDVKVKLFKGNIIIEGCKSPYSMMNPKVAIYGEENMMWTGAEALGFAKIYGMQSILANKVVHNNGNKEKNKHE